MFQIPWKLYSEIEVLEVLTLLFRNKGYQVYNVHKIDRRGEDGADLECTKPGETEKLLIACKKKPGKIDVGQLQTLAKRTARTKIYVHIEEPSADFRKAAEKVGNRVSFWNAEKLTYEVFSTDIRFYLFMIIENSFEIPVFEITRSFLEVYYNMKRKKAGKALKADSEMLNLLWVAKDRSSSLYKALRTLQTIFEEMNLSTFDEEIKKSVTSAFLKGLEELKHQSLDPLSDLFHEFLDKYPTNFEQFCEQTKGGSNWRYLASNRPQLSSGYIIKSLEHSREISAKLKDFMDKNNANLVKSDNLSDTLGDVSRILANETMWFEETVDDLFSIGVWGKWDDRREEFSRMSEERIKELKKGIKEELGAIKREITQNLKNKNFQRGISSTTDVFTTYREELNHRLSLRTFMAVQKAYMKISTLNQPTNLSDVNKRKHEESMIAIDKALTMLDSSDMLEKFLAEKKYLF